VTATETSAPVGAGFGSTWLACDAELLAALESSTAELTTLVTVFAPVVP
jgi:hypothetical protein